jgi:hypothetical protein
VFDSGDAMGAPSAVNLTGTVNPGQTVDLAVNLTSPSTADTYRGNFKLRNAAGVLFGLEPSGTAPFWVQIEVSPVTYSFYANAPSATWTTCGDPCGGGTTITFGGPADDLDGYAMYRDGVELENGNSPSQTFETQPMQVDNGVISGLFSNYTVQAGIISAPGSVFARRPTARAAPATWSISSITKREVRSARWAPSMRPAMAT